MWALDEIVVRFGATIAVDGVSLSVADGEIVVILGPSGCGKSTLLRAIAGLQPLDAGSILIDGADATKRPPHERGIGLMFQDHALFPHRDVGRNVEFGLRMAAMAGPDRTARVAEMLALVGLEGYDRRDVSTLSGGEAQRVALARSLAPRPALLLLDEPLGSLDRALRDRLTDDLPSLLRATGTAALHVTHDHDEAFAVADRIVVMDHGRVLRDGPPGEVWADPRTAAVARFLGHRNIVGKGTTRRVIRRDAASIDPTGDVTGTVLSNRFRGDHHDVTVAVADHGELHFRLADAPGVGYPIRLRIDPDRVAPIED